MDEAHVHDIARVIQLAVAPVFLLTALGTLLAVLSTRLGRIAHLVAESAPQPTPLQRKTGKAVKALGLAAARMGRRVLVLTIDPAKRLAQAMGIREHARERAALASRGGQRRSAPPSRRSCRTA